MKSFLITAAAILSLAGCAHQIKGPEDLRINSVYKLEGAPVAELKECTLKPQNIVTVVPTEAGPIPIELMGTKASVCGEIDCSKVKADMKGFDCLPIEFLQSSKSE